MTQWDIDMPQEVRQALDALSLLSRKWHPVVLAVLASREQMGFNELLDAIPEISGKVLSETLDALGEAGLVERTVVSESPLRVEYELTEAGADIEDVFEALAGWGDEHLESVTPTVLLADEDRRITEMYSNWLEDGFTTVRAHDDEQLQAALLEEIDVALFDRRLPGLEPSRVPDLAGNACRTIMLVDDISSVDILDVGCDDILFKPLVRETALAAIKRQLDNRGESPQRREYRALSAKREALEDTHSSEFLADNSRYAELCSRIETLEVQLEN